MKFFKPDDFSEKYTSASSAKWIADCANRKLMTEAKVVYGTLKPTGWEVCE